MLTTPLSHCSKSRFHYHTFIGCYLCGLLTSSRGGRRAVARQGVNSFRGGCSRIKTCLIGIVWRLLIRDVVENVMCELKTGCGSQKRGVAAKDEMWQPKTGCGNQTRDVAAKDEMWQPKTRCGSQRWDVADKDGMWQPKTGCGSQRICR